MALKQTTPRTALVRAMCVATLFVHGCSGGADPNPDAGAGAGGTGGAAGMGGTGGDAGTGGSGGTGGDGATGGTGGMDPVDPDASYMPLATGNTWTFQTTAAGVVETKTQTIGDWGPVGGTGPNSTTMAFNVLTEKADGADMTESWQAEVNDQVIRYRERSYRASTGALALEEHWEPFKLRLDMTEPNTMLDATWVETYNETKQPVDAAPSTVTASDTWRVVGVDESVTVPAGTFNALVIEKTSGTSTKRYWFVRGVGKVKETGAQTEELVSYDLVE